ncbi:MAG: membrane protein insertase YidC, partial [Gammaproteobacteria bacterium]|nr:membrane protein insertase YidC [Gammaproteobacteria bacterium]
MDNSRLFLFAALVFVGMLLWQQWQADYGPQPVTSSEIEASGINQDQPAGLIADDLPDQAENASGSAATATSSTGESASTTTAAQQLLRIETDVVQALVDTKGGVLRSIKLKKYPISLEQPDDGLELIHSTINSAHVLQSGLRNKEDRAPNHYSIYQADRLEYELADGEDELIVPLRWSQDGIEVIKTFHFKRGDYLIDVKHHINNQSAQDWLGSEYRQIQRTRPLETSRLLYTYTGSVYYNEITKYEKVDFDDMEDSQLKLESTGGWIAMIQHYFLSAWIPGQEDQNLIYSISNTKRDPSTYTIGLRSQNRLVAAGGEGEFSSQLFVGPKIVRRLEEISPGLELTVDYGVLTFLSKPLYWLLSWYHGFVGNWGV